MYFRIAESLGMTVRQMLRSIDSAELTEWLAYYALQGEDPRGALQDESPEQVSQRMKQLLFREA